MSNIIKFPILVLYCSAISRLAVWLKTGSWPTFTAEALLVYPPPSSFDIVNVVVAFLWGLPIEFWFIAPVAAFMRASAATREGPRRAKSSAI